MKRSTSSSIRPGQQSFKKSKKIVKSGSNYIGSLPQEIQTEILARVSSTSCKDVINCKMSCKLFKEIGEDRHVYRHISLDKVPIVLSWSRPDEHKRAFLDKCLESDNPEVNYRQAVMDYFCEKKLESAYKCLQRAVNSGHTGALYVTCIVLLISGEDNDSKELGVKLLSGMKRSNSDRRKVKDCRKKLIEQLRMMWVDHPSMETRSVFCKKHKQDYGLLRCDIDESEETLKCERCSADWEINFICGYNLVVGSMNDCGFGNQARLWE